MPTYRCFCRTADQRVITGALIDAEDLPSLLVLAQQRWRDIEGFYDVEVWLQACRVAPGAQQPQALLASTSLSRGTASHSEILRLPAKRVVDGQLSRPDGTEPAEISHASERVAAGARAAGFRLHAVEGLAVRPEAKRRIARCRTAEQADHGSRLEPRAELGLALPSCFLQGQENSVSLLDRHTNGPWTADLMHGVAHDLAQILTAILDYLYASRRLVAEERPICNPDLEHAVAGAIEQANRACEAVRHLRSAGTGSAVVLVNPAQ